MQALIPKDKLRESQSLLVMSHFALGDFLYQKTFIEKLKEAYPHLQIDLWIDPLKEKNYTRAQHVQSSSFDDWHVSLPFIRCIHNKAHSKQEFSELINTVQAEQYDIVAFYASTRAEKFAQTAKLIAPKAYRAGIAELGSMSWWKRFIVNSNTNKSYIYSQHLAEFGEHKSDHYAFFYAKLFGIETPNNERAPSIVIPDKWLNEAKDNCKQLKANVDEIVFINPTGSNKKKNWPYQHCLELAKLIKQNNSGKNQLFLINTIPDKLDELNQFISANISDELKNQVRSYTGSNNFFQYPAMIATADKVISIDSSANHFASATNKPLVALMRHNNPEWKPFPSDNMQIVYPENRQDWLDKISPARVFAAYNKLS